MLTLLLTWSSLLFAQETYTIHRIEPQNRAVIATTKADEISVQDEFNVETPLGVCKLVVTKIVTDYVYLNTEQCQSEYVQKGTTIVSNKKVVVERAPTVAQEIPQPTANQSISSQPEWMQSEFFQNYVATRLSVYFSYYTGTALDGQIAIAGDRAEDFKGSNAMGFGADYRIADLPYSLSVVGGMAYALPRGYGRYRSANFASTLDFGNNPELQMFSFYGNLRYQFHDKAYAVFGLNRLLTEMSNVPGDMDGDFGFHVGARYYPLAKFFLDGNINFYNMDYDNGPEKADFSLTELEVKAGYTF